MHTDLQRYEIGYREIIPVIETKQGMENLEAIIKKNTAHIRSIAFGHCDYNLDIGAYPFFHQDTREYWTWIFQLAAIAGPYQIRIVNSPYLQLDNNAGFDSMLAILQAICGNNIAQITLTKTQTVHCNAFRGSATNLNLSTIKNRHDLSVPPHYADQFIEAFEENCSGKGFALEGTTLLSPQEYKASLEYRTRLDLPAINFAFVGGCFPVQGNMPFEDRFHQVIKRNIESTHPCRLDVRIIRYERLVNCAQKIEMHHAKHPIDILAFSIRPEPFLRLVKLYYRFLDTTTGKTRWSLNLPWLQQVNPEKFDLLSVVPGFSAPSQKDKTFFHKALINFNYILGSLLGNDAYALREYGKLLTRVIDVCHQHHIPLIILGPPIRSNTRLEKYLSGKLDRFFKKSLADTPIGFVNGSDEIHYGNPLFTPNGIYATKQYHALIAERMVPGILSGIETHVNGFSRRDNRDEEVCADVMKN